jgi:hypothetical protein
MTWVDMRSGPAPDPGPGPRYGSRIVSGAAKGILLVAAGRPRARAHAARDFHISWSRSAVQMRGLAIPLASSNARDTSNGMQCS